MPLFFLTYVIVGRGLGVFRGIWGLDSVFGWGTGMLSRIWTRRAPRQDDGGMG